MPSVISEVICPLCGGTMIEDLDCRAQTADYFCQDCGYGTSTEYGLGDVPPLLLPFAEEVEVDESLGWSFGGTFFLAPQGVVVVGQYLITPVNDVKRGKLLWERQDAVKRGGRWKYVNPRLYETWQEAKEGYLFTTEGGGR